MRRLETKRTILASFLPGLTSLTKRGSAGWMVIIGSVIVSSIVIMTLISPWIAPSDPTAAPPVIDNPLRAPPSWEFPMGTNKLGQDMLSRVLCGGAVMLQVAV
ncbi:MAG: hypothetical protein OEY83_08340, partial [Candidatus Bathyarchaeota archaeon]|nr:hypothetical protein [Candidatus Bathyarchaeota archaeon]